MIEHAQDVLVRATQMLPTRSRKGLGKSYLSLNILYQVAKVLKYICVCPTDTQMHLIHVAGPVICCMAVEPRISILDDPTLVPRRFPVPVSVFI